MTNCKKHITEMSRYKFMEIMSQEIHIDPYHLTKTKNRKDQMLGFLGSGFKLQFCIGEQRAECYTASYIDYTFQW